MTWLSRFAPDDGFSLIRNGVVSVAIKAAGIALVMLVAVVLARYLGPACTGGWPSYSRPLSCSRPCPLSDFGEREQARGPLRGKKAPRLRRTLRVVWNFRCCTGSGFVGGGRPWCDRIIPGAGSEIRVLGSRDGRAGREPGPVVVSGSVLVALDRPVAELHRGEYQAAGHRAGCRARHRRERTRFTANAAANLTIIGNIIPAIVLPSSPLSD